MFSYFAQSGRLWAEPHRRQSYVVLFDPWWNPAVENQAIDRTHRIGQTSKVIAYRLLMKDSIEEKIRALQKQKAPWRTTCWAKNASRKA